jgi:hypothetical protein
MVDDGCAARHGSFRAFDPSGLRSRQRQWMNCEPVSRCLQPQGGLRSCFGNRVEGRTAEGGIGRRRGVLPALFVPLSAHRRNWRVPLRSASAVACDDRGGLRIVLCRESWRPSLFGGQEETIPGRNAPDQKSSCQTAWRAGPAGFGRPELNDRSKGVNSDFSCGVFQGRRDARAGLCSPS